MMVRCRCCASEIDRPSPGPSAMSPSIAMAILPHAAPWVGNTMTANRYRGHGTRGLTGRYTSMQHCGRQEFDRRLAARHNHPLGSEAAKFDRVKLNQERLNR